MAANSQTTCVTSYEKCWSRNNTLEHNIRLRLSLMNSYLSNFKLQASGYKIRVNHCQSCFGNISKAIIWHYVAVIYNIWCTKISSSRLLHEFWWWSHQMETFSLLLALCAGNSLMTCEFPSQWPVIQMFSLIFARTNGWVNNWDSGDLRRHHTHYDITVMWKTTVWEWLHPIVTAFNILCPVQFYIQWCVALHWTHWGSYFEKLICPCLGS